MTIAFTVLYRIIGPSCIAGIACIFVASPLNQLIASRFVTNQRRILAARDSRISLISEALTGLKFIKLFAWEDSWIQRITSERRRELSGIVRRMKLT